MNSILDFEPEENYDIRRWFNRMETSGFAEKEEKVRIKMLRKEKVDSPCYMMAQSLAKRMTHAYCENDYHISMASSVTMHQFRVFLGSEMIRNFKDDAPLYLVTIVPLNECLEEERLESFSPQRFKDKLKKQLRRSGVDACCVVGGIEIDFHTNLGCWVPHFHLLVSGVGRRQLEAFKEKHYKGSLNGGSHSIGTRPMLIQTVKNIGPQLSYVFKLAWFRREKYVDRHGTTRTGKYRLHQKQHTQALLVMDKFVPTEFIFMYGMRRYGAKISRV